MSNAIKSAPRKRARRWNESQAAEALRECQKSGLTIEAYAKREGYSGQRLRNWKRRLGGELTVPPMNFMPVTIAEADARALTLNGISGSLSIDVGRVTVRLREDLDVEHLARIVGALDRITR